MKRSRAIRLVLLGGFSAGAVPLSAQSANEPRITSESYYTNDYFIQGAGYYHAPFRAFYPQRYNHYDPQRKLYYHGGQWRAAPHRSIVNISTPTAEAVRAAETARGPLPVTRSGFGRTSRSHGVWS